MTGRVGVVDERIAERRREVREGRRRRRLRRTVTVLGLVVLLVVGVLVERSSLVALSEIRVAGTERLAPEAVVAAADLTLGTSTLRLDLGAAEERVRALPLVRTADASRVDPLTVLITVEERAPVLVAASGTETVLVDPEGVVIATGRIRGLPTIVLPERVGLPAPGQEVGAQPALAAAFAIHGQLPTALQRQVTRLAAHAADDVDLTLADGIQVRFGRADRIDEKARALQAVLADVRDVPVKTIDVRAPSNPVVRS